MKTIKKNIFSIIVGIVILFLSFSNAKTFDKVSFLYFPHIDKIIHFCMYFGLMLTLAFENRMARNNTRLIFLLALISFTYGALIEIMQSLLTTTRTGDIFDLCFNTLGIISAIIFWISLKYFLEKRIK